MNKIFGFLFLLITINVSGQSIQDDFPNNIENKRTNKHIQLKGTKIFIVLPQDYYYNKEENRYENNKLHIMFLDSKIPFTQMRPNFTKDILVPKVGEINVLKDIRINNYDAIYYESSNKYSGKNNIVIVLGDDSIFVMIEGVYKSSDIEGKKELKEILSSLVYDKKSVDLNPLENANFSFDLSITNFKYLLTSNNFFIYSKDGKDITSNAFNIGEKSDITEDKAQNYANDLLKTAEENGVSLNSKKIIKTKINNYAAYTIETGFKYKNKPGLLYQVVLIGEKTCIVFVGNAYDNLSEDVIKYKKTVESINIK